MVAVSSMSVDYKTKYLEPHGLFEDQTFEEFCDKLPVFWFRKEIPDDVIKNFEVVEKLLAHSYFEYKFIDEAFTKAIHTFEMAMRIRYKDFHQSKQSLSFNSLIIKLSELNLFDTSLETLKHLKSMRNNFAHPDRHSFAGTIYWNSIEKIPRLINEMYEDVNLRAERVSKAQEFVKELRERNLESGIVLQTSSENVILFRLQLLMINNKHAPMTYLLACTPIFDLAPIGETGGNVPQLLGLKVINPVFDGSTLVAENFFDAEVITFRRIEDCKEVLNEYESWNSIYMNHKLKFMYESTVNFNIPLIFNPEVKEFQRL